MPAKNILLFSESRRRIAEGVDLIARALSVTYGPKGGNVIIQRPWGAPKVTRDGFTVAKEIELENKENNLGVELMKDVVDKTYKEAGDGTTTTAILTEALLKGGLKLIAAGYDPMALANGINIAYQDAFKRINKMKREIRGRRDIAHIATVACAGNVELGDLVAQAVEKAGKHRLIVVEESKTTTTLRTIEGMLFDRGYISPYFITDKKRMEAVLEDVLVLIHEKRIGNVNELLPILEKVASSGKSFLIIAEDVEGEALATIVLNKLQGTLKCCAVKAPGYGERRKKNLGDIALLTGGCAILEETGVKLEDVEISDLGKVKRAIISKEETLLIGGAGRRDSIEARIEQLRDEVATTESDYDREQLEKRIARLAGGLIEIAVGGATEVEVKHKKAILEGAIKAVQAAKLDGLLPGGGVAYIRAAQSMNRKSFLNEAEAVGYQLLRDALEAPLRQLAINSGEDPSTVIQRVKKGRDSYGYDVEKRKYTDLMKSGIVDASLVVKIALRNAVSAASILLTTEASLTEIEEKKKKPDYPGADEMPDLDEY